MVKKDPRPTNMRGGRGGGRGGLLLLARVSTTLSKNISVSATNLLMTSSSIYIVTSRDILTISCVRRSHPDGGDGVSEAVTSSLGRTGSRPRQDILSRRVPAPRALHYTHLFHLRPASGGVYRWVGGGVRGRKEGGLEEVVHSHQCMGAVMISIVTA